MHHHHYIKLYQIYYQNFNHQLNQKKFNLKIVQMINNLILNLMFILKNNKID